MSERSADKPISYFRYLTQHIAILYNVFPNFFQRYDLFYSGLPPRFPVPIITGQYVHGFENIRVIPFMEFYKINTIIIGTMLYSRISKFLYDVVHFYCWSFFLEGF